MPSKTKQITVDRDNRVVLTDVFTDKARGIADKKGGRKVKGAYDATFVTSGEGTRLRRLALDGTWSLTPKHDLEFRVLGTGSPYSGKTLVFRGEINKVGGNSLGFRVRQCDTLSGMRTGTIQLAGKWRADANNRITFDVAKKSARYDALTFQGAWQVNRRNEIIYKYARTSLKTRIKEERTLVFKGYWDLGKNRLVYHLERSADSAFCFKAALQSRSLIAAEGAIKYQVGIKFSGAKAYRRIDQTVTIYGTWKFSRDLKVGFEVKYAGGKRKEIRFLVEELIGETGAVTVALKSAEGERLGIEVSFTKTFKNDAELLPVPQPLRLRKQYNGRSARQILAYSG